MIQGHAFYDEGSIREQDMLKGQSRHKGAEQGSVVLVYTVLHEGVIREQVVLSGDNSAEQAKKVHQALTERYGLDENNRSADEMTWLEINYTVLITDVEKWLTERKGVEL